MNHLHGSASPYLRQHADNPVDWHPWGDEALARARGEDKPLFVSVGYAACHWCHVMAHESFEDAETAEDLSRWFVAIKVDREERPDVDAVYMAAVQAMTGAGGWPMSVFCTPDGRPFFAGTYFPPIERHGMPSFRRVLAAVAEAWSERREDIERQADALAVAVGHQVRVADAFAAPSGDRRAPAWAELTEHAVAQLAARFDNAWGGFGPAPKFPRPAFVDLCLREHVRTGDPAPLAMATTTLDAMAAGGIYDHLEGGFARYATDREWTVPHFEKMLTDQALLLRAYLHAWQLTGRSEYRQILEETVAFVSERLRAPSGGLFSSVDADAAGAEGSHVTWTPGEVRDALAAGDGDGDGAKDDGDVSALDVDALCEWYGVSAEGNFEGRSVPRRPLHAPLLRPPAIEAGRRVLLAARRARPQPAIDDKVLTEWNAMFAAALAEAAGATTSREWATDAVRIADALLANNRRADGRLLRATGSDVLGFAADYAWTIECCTRLAELTGQRRWIVSAEELAGELLSLFWDDERDALYTTGVDAQELIVRPKDVVDGAVPSANAIAAIALLRLGALTGSARWSEAGRRIVEAGGRLLTDEPLAVGDLVFAVGLLDDGAEIVVAGDRQDLVRAVRTHWLPTAVFAWGEPGASALWEGRRPGAAYVCRHFTCDLPAPDVATLDAQLVHLGAVARR